MHPNFFQRALFRRRKQGVADGDRAAHSPAGFFSHKDVKFRRDWARWKKPAFAGTHTFPA
jgi:hypothetical protein